MKIKICRENQDVIQKHLDKANYNCSVRLIQYGEVEGISKDAEIYLDSIALPKKLRNKIKIGYHELVHCNSYSKKGSYYAGSTHFDIIRGTKHWYFTGAYREDYPTGNTGHQTNWELLMPAVNYIGSRAANKAVKALIDTEL